jgi:uncharacterized protein YndB with AHSA1/START domain
MSAVREAGGQVHIATTAEMAFEALTEARGLREWLCDLAWTDVHLGGHYELRWREGYRTQGQFVDLEAPHRAAVSWWGRGEPGKTSVECTIEPANNGVLVTTTHRGFRPGTRWDRALANAESGWETARENLKSTLETGLDLRQVRQPFLGIVPDLLDAQQAVAEGIAAEKGIYVANTVAGCGADAAGLRRGDVLVTLGGEQTGEFSELAAALRTCRAGGRVEAQLVRGQERRTIEVTLGSRPQEEVPSTADALAQCLSERQLQAITALRASVEGLTDDEASRRPADGAWSVKEVLAHLLLNEQDYGTVLAVIALDGWFDAGPSNPALLPARLHAVLATTPTVSGLLDRLTLQEASLVVFLSELPEETVMRRACFRRIGQAALGLVHHTYEHIDQIGSTLRAVRAQ